MDELLKRYEEAELARGCSQGTAEWRKACARSYLRKGYAPTPESFKRWETEYVPTTSERSCVRKFLLYVGIDAREIPKKKIGRPSGPTEPRPVRPELSDEQKRARAFGRMKVNAGLFDFKLWLETKITKRDVLRTLRTVRNYLQTNEPTPESFAVWAPSVDSRTRSQVRKYLIFLGIDYRDTLVAISEKQRKAIEARARFYEELGENLRRIPAPFTIERAAESLGISKERIKQYLTTVECYRLPAFYSGETARRTYVYAFEPFDEDAIEYELNDPIKQDDVTLDVQLFGDELAAYEELKTIKDKWQVLEPEQIRERLKKCLERR